MSQHNMSLLIGSAFSARPIASILSPFALRMLVDHFFVSQKMMVVMHLTGTTVLWFAPQALVAQSGALLVGLLLGYTLCHMPMLALTNNIAFHSSSDKDKTFPVVWVFGTIDWIVAGIFIGATGISDIISILTLAAIISVILALYSLTLPNTPAPAKGLSVKIRDLFCVDTFVLLKVHHFLVFSLCTTLTSVSLGIYYAYTASFLIDAGVGDVSTAMPSGRTSEIFFMLVIPFLFRRLGAKYMLLIGMRAWFVCYAFFVLGISEERRLLLYLGILLHGMYYDFFFMVGFIYASRIAGEEVKDQAQSMIVMFTYGIGTLLSSQISGALYNRLMAGRTVSQAWTVFWWIPAVAAVVITMIFLFSFKHSDKEQTQLSEGVMKTIKGLGILLTQFIGGHPPFNTLEGMAKQAAELDYGALQIPRNCKSLFDVEQAAVSQGYCDGICEMLTGYGLVISELSTHPEGQLVVIRPAYDDTFDEFAPPSVRASPQTRQAWAIEALHQAVVVSQGLGLAVHATFSSSSAWPLFYPWPPHNHQHFEEAFLELARRWRPILDRSDHHGVGVCFEIHPGKDLHDGVTFERLLTLIDSHPRCNILYDPSHLLLQQMDYLGFIDVYHSHIRAFRVKNVECHTSSHSGVYGGYQPWFDHAGRFRSLGNGQVDFKTIFSKFT